MAADMEPLPEPELLPEPESDDDEDESDDDEDMWDPVWAAFGDAVLAAQDAAAAGDDPM